MPLCSGCFNARLTLECLYSMLDRCVARDKNLLLFCSCFCCRYFLWALNVSTCVPPDVDHTSLKYRTRTHTLVLGHNKSTFVHNMHRNKNSIYNELRSPISFDFANSLLNFECTHYCSSGWQFTQYTITYIITYETVNGGLTAISDFWA